MIVQCDSCNTKFRLDDSKVKDKGVRVRCTKCQNVFVVMPPPSPGETPPKPEETFGASFETKAEAPQKEKEKGAAGSPEEAVSPTKEEKKSETPSWEIDFTFKEKPEEKEKKSEWDIGLSSTKEESPASFEEKKETFGIGKEEKFGFEIGKESASSFEVKKRGSPSPEASKFTFDEGFAPPLEKTSFEIEPPPTEEEFVIPTKEEAKTVVMQAPVAAPIPTPPPAEKSEKFLTTGFGETKEVLFEMSSEKKSKGIWLLLFLVIFLLIAGGGVFYLKRGSIATDFLSKLTSIKAAPQKSMELTGLKGYYVNNPSTGRLFVIEGKLISDLDEPKEITGVHGIVYDKNGRQIKDAWVAPGRIVSQGELKSLSMIELEKRFKDRKGIIPAKGTVPFMIIFPGASGDLSEFGVEVGQ